MSYDRKTKFSKNHKNPSFPKLVPRVLPFRLEGREPQNRKIEKIQFFIFSGGGYLPSSPPSPHHHCLGSRAGIIAAMARPIGPTVGRRPIDGAE